MAAIPKEILEEIRRIEIHAGHLAEDLLAGAYRSVFKGQGLEFEEVREYVPGDDVRSIDWNVTARFNHPYVKIFREEREIPIFLMIDISPSSLGGSGKTTKREAAAKIAALLSFSALKNNDKTGLILFSEDVEKYIPPRKGFRHALRIIRDTPIDKPKGRETNLKKSIDFLMKIQKRSAIVFITSDFLAPLCGKELSLLAKRADLIGINCVDAWESALPPLSLVEMWDPESEKTLIVDLGDKKYLEWYKEEMQKKRGEWKKAFSKAGTFFLTIQTDASPVNALKKFFRFRKSRL